MPFASRRSPRLLALPLALTLLAAACAGGADSAGTGLEDQADAGGGSAGTVNISGSSTVLPVSQLAAESYADAGNEGTINVDGPGTGDGFQLFCEGETDISDASRPIAEDEIATCEENGIDFIELYIAIDGLSIITNPAFTALECLNFADMYALSGPESQRFTTWSDAQAIATELGSQTQFPDVPLDISAPGEESGTYDSYVEIVIENYSDDRGQEAQTRPDYQSSGDDNIILQGIEGSDTSYGWVGYAYFVENEGAVKAFQVAAEPGGECVAPTPETIASGDYPISRPLFIYVNADKAESNPALAPFVDHYLSDEGMAAVAEAGYVDIPEEDLEATRQTWEDRTTGTQFGA